MSQNRATADILLAAAFLALAVIWAVVIYSFSSQDSDESASLSGEVAQVIADTLEADDSSSNIEHIIRKTAHFLEYGVFGSLIFASTAFFLKWRGRKPYLAVIASTLAAMLYAASDEYHQTLVPGRSGEVKDVLIDTSGALAASAFICLILRLRERKSTVSTQEQEDT